jgi:hypothetical protein
MLHPEMLRALGDARVNDLRRAGRGSARRVRPRRRRTTAAIGWMLIDVGFKIAARSQPQVVAQ